ncbi:MAG: carbohydrate-binding protein, partial [Planctomycetia bacterium]|nr:carbohydrate-binding protein [Planctomycetia bacterium]
MHAAILLWVGFLAGEVRDYSRALDARRLDQATLDAEGYGEKKKGFKREDGGLRVTLNPGDAETGWKTPQALKVGGDFTVTAEFLVRKLPKPAQDDGVAVGLSVATQNVDRPEATLARLIETSGSDVFHAFDKSKDAPPREPEMMIQPGPRRLGQPQPGGKAAKPSRRTFPARG